MATLWVMMDRAVSQKVCSFFSIYLLKCVSPDMVLPLHQGWLTLVLKNLNPACLPALPGLPDADCLKQVCSVNQDAKPLESANKLQADQGELENRPVHIKHIMMSSGHHSESSASIKSCRLHPPLLHHLPSCQTTPQL